MKIEIENWILKIEIEIVANLASHPVRSLWFDVKGKVLQGDSEILATISISIFKIQFSISIFTLVNYNLD